MTKTLTELEEQLKENPTKKHEFIVPTMRGTNFGITRKPNEIQKLISDSIEGGLYEQTIIVIVAFVESYLNHLLAKFITWFPAKLAIAENKIDVKWIIDSQNYEELILKVIEHRIQSFFYDSPSKYLETIEKMLDVSLILK